MNSFDRLSETKLPSKNDFYSELNNTDISVKDYKHAKNVWTEFKCKTIRDYHDLYLELDVILLTDVMDKFRSMCTEFYGLDAMWYYTAPGLAWDAALKKTGIVLEQITDPDMYVMIERGIRGGVSTITKRYSKANNKYMKVYDPELKKTFIIYLDANNLYGWAMVQPLPIKDFVWMNDNELKDWAYISGELGIGCILEVDLTYPKELHNLHNDYPFAPERVTPEGSKVPKLIPNLNNKTKYVLHHGNLKQYIENGLILTKVHRGIKFTESEWLEPYISMNTTLRSKADNEFEKDFYKLMNNSVFGKTMENVRNRVDVRLVTNEEQLYKLVRKHNYRTFTNFSEHLTAVHMFKTTVLLDKPIYLGMCILDISKTLMYNFHYGYIKKKYGEKAKLIFTDTDSLCYEINTDDFYDDIKDDILTHFDTSNYPEDHPSGIQSNINKKLLGKMKDESKGKQIAEIVGLRSKLYALKMDTGEEDKKCKGVKKSTIKNNIEFSEYYSCLFDGIDHYKSMNIFRSRGHKIFTERVTKKALSSNDDKRIVLEDRVHTLAHGHWAHIPKRGTNLIGMNYPSDGTLCKLALTAASL